MYQCCVEGSDWDDDRECVSMLCINVLFRAVLVMTGCGVLDCGGRFVFVLFLFYS